jgi:hypothetical protein
VFSSENPVNGSTRLRPSFLWSINISDPDGDLFNWTIECSNGQSNSSTNDTNGTKQVSLSELSHFVIYVVWVNATDQHGLEMKEWFVFTTKKAVITEKKLVSKHPLVDTNGLEDGEETPSIPGFELLLFFVAVVFISFIFYKKKNIDKRMK